MLDGSHVFALNLTNAGMGLLVGGIVVAVLVAAAHDATVHFRRWRKSRRPGAHAEAEFRTFCAVSHPKAWKDQ